MVSRLDQLERIFRTVVAALTGVSLLAVPAAGQDWRRTGRTLSQDVRSSEHLIPPSFELDEVAHRSILSSEGRGRPTRGEPAESQTPTSDLRPLSTTASGLESTVYAASDSASRPRDWEERERSSVPPTHLLIRPPQPPPGPTLWEGIFGSSQRKPPAEPQLARRPLRTTHGFPPPQASTSDTGRQHRLGGNGGIGTTAELASASVNPFPLQSDMAESYHPPHAAMRRRFRRPTATIPGGRSTEIWKAPYSYGYFGASATRHWERDFGSRDRATTWRLR